MKKKNIQYLQELALVINSKCLSLEYLNSKTKYKWQCDKKHIWEETANRIQQGWGCPQCGFKKEVKKEGICWQDGIYVPRGFTRNQIIDLINLRLETGIDLSTLEKRERRGL